VDTFSFPRTFFKHTTRRSFFRSLTAPGRILDLGCGSGANSKELHDVWPLAELHGIDLQQDVLLPDYVHFARVDLDGEMLPYPDGYFDAIVFSHVVEHLKNPLTVAAEINRVMRPGAELYMEAPNWTSALVPSFGFHREQKNPTNFYDDPTHLRPWTKQALFGYAADNCALKVSKVGTVCNWWRLPFDIPLLFVALATGRRDYMINAIWNMTGWAIYVRARKV
jgi:ubiquinone/menaquinone biosynthesis C-methylase UbiE